MAEMDPRQTGTLRTEEMLLNMGPHHPSTHGVLRFVLTTDGEVISHADPDVGFLHRSIEKIGEKVTYPQFAPYTDRVDYLSAMTANWAYALAVETLLGVEAPRRAQVLRVIVAELNRIANHLITLGSIALDIGAATPFTLMIRDREVINDLFEALCGQRLTYHYIRIGGVSHDLPDFFVEKARNFLDYFIQESLPELNALITGNKILLKRLGGTTVIDAETAIDYGIVGPNLRASGVDWDLRRDEPYGIYPELEFEVPVGRGEYGIAGDGYDRWIVRVREMEQSARLVRQCLDKLEEGEIQAKLKRILKVPAGEAYVRTESSRGEMGYHIVSDGSQVAHRMRIRTGSFSSISAMEEVCTGLMVADLVVMISTLDIIAPEIDR